MFAFVEAIALLLTYALLQLYEKMDPEDQEPEDEEMLNHMNTLLTSLKEAGVPDPPVIDPRDASNLKGADDWEDLSEKGDVDMS